MITRRIVSVLIAVVGTLVALAPLHGAAPPHVDGLDPLPVEGVRTPRGPRGTRGPTPNPRSACPWPRSPRTGPA